jgi:hypothetical protein
MLLSSFSARQCCYRRQQLFPRPALPFALALPSHQQSVDVTDAEEDVLTLALLHKTICKIKKHFNKFLEQSLPCIVFFLFISVRRRYGVPNSWQLFYSYFSNK